MFIWIPFLPFIGFLINGLWYLFAQAPLGKKKASSLLTGIIASACIFLSFLVACSAFWELTKLPPESRFLEQTLFPWIHIGSFQLDFCLQFDVLSSLFVLVITGVGSLIHIYSMGYMAHDETPGKFFAYLNLFCFSMLILVMAPSLPLLFLGWEGVGLCSYLLIGYWYKDWDKAKAGKKAFITNRIGDLGFLLGMFSLYMLYGTLEFYSLREAVNSQENLISKAWITFSCLCLFLGCTGKSAQIPLYVWLPDAMAGPTPVSALIHAATMVTSGIYLLSRLHFLFSLSPTAMSVIATIGALTAFFAATIAFAQKDIKKVLAYSTVSQLGYMFLGCGVGAYTAGVFHVITHAFFKALLFLGAGSVIHGMHEEQNIFKMGGLKSHMPKTFFTFLIGWLAISGIPPFSGFFSKDEILWQTFSSQQGSWALWLLGLLTAGITAFYMTRLFFLVFLGSSRVNPKVHIHESPFSMTFPLQVLAVLSIVGGWVGIPHWSALDKWLEPWISESHEVPPHLASLEWVWMILSVLIAGLGVYSALRFYQDLEKVKKWTHSFAWVHRLLEEKWYVDEIYQRLLIQPLHVFSRFLWRIIDTVLIDGLVLSFGHVSQNLGHIARLVQMGLLQNYLLLFALGVLVFIGYLAYV